MVDTQTVGIHALVFFLFVFLNGTLSWQKRMQHLNTQNAIKIKLKTLIRLIMCMLICVFVVNALIGPGPSIRVQN